MPTLTLKVCPPQDAARHRALAGALTRITAETLAKRADVTAVVIDDVAASRWHVGGRSPTLPTAMLEVSVTAGTNSTQQKADFIAAAFAELERQLAPGASLQPASYVIVRELAASDWGYGGQTQRARQQSRPSAAEPAPA